MSSEASECAAVLLIVVRLQVSGLERRKHTGADTRVIECKFGGRQIWLFTLFGHVEYRLQSLQKVVMRFLN